MDAQALRIATIDDPADPRLADYRDLRDAELRRRHGCFVAEGREVVRRLLTARFRTRSVLLTPPALGELRDDLQAAGAGIEVLVAGHQVIRAVAGFPFHRGCLAVGERGSEPSLETLLAPAGPRLLLVLDELANPDNVGGVFRNAMAFGADAVLLSPGCADPLYRKAIRVSAGGSLRVPFARLPEGGADLPRLRAAGYAILALTPLRAATPIDDLGTVRPAPDRLALIVGAEGQGLSAASRAAADLEVRIAMVPGADSLNVATAAGIALHRLRPWTGRA